MYITGPKFQPVIFLLALTVVMGIAGTGCPTPGGKEMQAARFGISPDNILDIPPPGTEFEFEGSDIEWNLQPHPRILANPSAIELMGTVPEIDPASRLINAANANRALMEADPTFREATAPITFAWAYLITRDEKYMDAVRDSLKWLTDFPPIVKVPEGANIAWLEQANSLGGVYDLLYNDFSEEEKLKIETVLRETVFHTLAYKVTEYDREINFWANEPQTNYYLVFHSVAGLVSIALMGVEPDAEKLAGHSWERVKESMEFMDRENGWREGLTYLDFCWGQSALYFLLGVERNSKVKPFDNPWFAKSVDWAVWGALPDRKTIACFGDNEPENYSVGSYLYRMYCLTGTERFLDEAEKTRDVVDLALDLGIFDAACMGRDITRIDSGINAMGTEYFPGIEWGMIREGANSESGQWKPEDDFYLAFKSGHSGYDHNHLDQGSMILAAYGEILLSDPGRGGPDIIRRDPLINCLFEAGLGHNTLIVGDGCYEDLQLFPDNPAYFAEKGEMTSSVVTDEYIQYTTDNSGLYPTEPLTEFRRSFIYLKPGVVDGADLGVFVVADRVSFFEEVEHSMLFHTPGEVEMLDTARARLKNGDAVLDYYGFCSVETLDKQERQHTSMDIRDSTCYYRSTASPERDSLWIHVLIPCKVGENGAAVSPEPVITKFVMGNKITWDDYEIVLVLKRPEGWVVGNDIEGMEY